MINEVNVLGKKTKQREHFLKRRCKVSFEQLDELYANRYRNGKDGK